MTKISPHDLIFGVNDTTHFIHEASRRKGDSTSLKRFFIQTEKKRKWSLDNPGFLLAVAYSYLVFGYEKGLLEGFPFGDHLNFFAVTSSTYNDLKDDNKKALEILRRLRNSIAHCRYEVQIRSSNGKIQNDGNVWFVFTDQNLRKPDSSDNIKIEISFPNFGNFIERIGGHCMKKLKSM